MSFKLAVEGDAVAAMEEKDRWADIIEPAPHYVMRPDPKDPKKEIEKLLVTVRIKGQNIAEYYPHLTSARFIANKLGTGLENEDVVNWVGYKVIWGSVVDKDVFGTMKKVIYVTDVQNTKGFKEIKQ